MKKVNIKFLVFRIFFKVCRFIRAIADVYIYISIHWTFSLIFYEYWNKNVCWKTIYKHAKMIFWRKMHLPPSSLKSVKVQKVNNLTEATQNNCVWLIFKMKILTQITYFSICILSLKVPSTVSKSFFYWRGAKRDVKRNFLLCNVQIVKWLKLGCT